MDWQFKVGLGATVVFGLLGYAVKDMPHWITWPGIAAGTLFVLAGVVPFHGKLPSGPLLLFIACATGMVASVSWYLDGPPAGAGGARISFQKYALFWVTLEKDVYQLGMVAKFVNMEDQVYLVDNLSFDRIDWSLYPRGSYLIQRMLVNECKADLIGDSYIKPNNDGYIKALLPIKLFMVVNGGEAPELIIRGKWNLGVGPDPDRVVPGMYSVYPKFLSLQEWEALRTSKSSVQIDDLHFKPIPPRPSADSGPYMNYLVYNSDRTATIDNVYFAQTLAAKGQQGTIVFIRGRGQPPLGIGWTVLGRTYYEVWSDPKKLSLYNSLFPPGDDGLPKPLGFFAGSEDEMAGPVARRLSAPTTRAADIMEINSPCDGNKLANPLVVSPPSSTPRK